MKKYRIIAKIFDVLVNIALLVLIVSALWGCRYDEATTYLLVAVCIKLEAIRSKLS